MKNLYLILSATAIFLCTSFTNKKEKLKIMAEKPESIVTYNMRHPLHEWEAINKDVNCVIIYNTDTEKIENVAVVLKVEGFDSKNANRDSHALELLEALKYPKVTFSSNNIQYIGDVMSIIGNLTFHGVTQPVTIRSERKIIEKKLQVEGFFKANLSDFKIERPSLLGLSAEDEIRMYFKVIFKINKDL